MKSSIIILFFSIIIILTGMVLFNVVVADASSDDDQVMVCNDSTTEGCECLNNYDCSPGYYCSKPKGECGGAGICEPRFEACMMYWAPVCGCDGKTYSNGGCAGIAGVSVAYKGKCQSGGYYCDMDNDGFISTTPYKFFCSPFICGPSGCQQDPGDDCNDSDPEVNPGAVEGPVGDLTCRDRVDNDCDGSADKADSGCDGEQISGMRTLPDVGAPDTDMEACYDIDVDEGSVPSGLIVNEYVPIGWEVSTCSTSYKDFDTAAGKISWLFIGDEVKDRSFCCDIHIPMDEETEAVRTFNGELVYNDSDGNPVTAPIDGDQEITINDLPETCDANHDWTIDDFELLDFIDMWTAGSYCRDAASGKYKAGAHNGMGMCK